MSSDGGGDAASEAAADAPSDRYAPDFKKEIADLFNMFDDCCTGQVDAVEIRRAAPGLLGRPLTDADDLHVFTNAELDNDGMLNYEEFAEWFEKRLRPTSQDDHIKASFDLFVAPDDPHAITQYSVRRALEDTGVPVADNRLEEVITSSSTVHTSEVALQEYSAVLKFSTPDAG